MAIALLVTEGLPENFNEEANDDKKLSLQDIRARYRSYNSYTPNSKLTYIFLQSFDPFKTCCAFCLFDLGTPQRR